MTDAIFLQLAQHAQAPAESDGQSLGVVLVVMLAAAALISGICRRLRVEAIPGYLVAGALIGPHALGIVHSESGAQGVTQLATVLLLFTIGLQLELESIRRGLVHILAVASAATVIFILVYWGVLLLAGVDRPAGLALAMAGSISSTAILVRILQERRELHQLHGRVSMGFSIVQDLSSVAMLASLPLLAAWAGQGSPDPATGVMPGWAEKLLAGGRAVGGVILMLWLGRVALPAILDRIARLGSQELLLVSTAALALLSAAWTSYIGFSPEMGAFLAGFMLAGTPQRYQLAGQLAPMRDLLMAVFFTSIGLIIDVRDVFTGIVPIVTLTGALMIAKLIINGGLTWLAGMTPAGSLLTAVYNINAGEFSLVVVAAAAAASIIDPTQSAQAIAVVVLTLIATPFLVQPAHLLTRRLQRVPLSPWIRSTVLRDQGSTGGAAPGTPVAEAEGTGGADSSEGEQGAEGDGTRTPRPRHVIIAGFGPVGRGLADRLHVRGIGFTVVELNASTVQRQHVLGRKVIYGDITNRDVLESAGLREADAVLLTIPDDEATFRAVQAVRELAPRVFIGARTQFLSGKFVAMSLGADAVTVSEVATATAMEREVLEALGEHLARRAREAQTEKSRGESESPRPEES